MFGVQDPNHSSNVLSGLPFVSDAFYQQRPATINEAYLRHTDSGNFAVRYLQSIGLVGVIPRMESPIISW